MLYHTMNCWRRVSEAQSNTKLNCTKTHKAKSQSTLDDTRDLRENPGESTDSQALWAYMQIYGYLKQQNKR